MIAAVKSRETTRGVRTSCTHCGLPVPAGLIDPSVETQFCCAGCRAVYETLSSCGLTNYYAVREAVGDDRTGARNVTQTGAFVGDDADPVRVFDAFDDPAFLEAHVTQASDGTCSMNLLVQGVHCTACAWLIDRLPKVVPGVIEARLSLRDADVHVRWSPDQVKPSAIALGLHRMGYTPAPHRSEGHAARYRAESRAHLVRLGIAGACAGNVMLLAFGMYAAEIHAGSAGMSPGIESLFRWLSAGVGLTALLWPGRVFFRGALAACRARTVNLDVPIALALGVGAASSTWNVMVGQGDIYFDSLTVLVFLLLAARAIQHQQQRWAMGAVGLLDALTPPICRRVVAAGDRDPSHDTDALPKPATRSVPIEAVSLGDELEVWPGEPFPVDGVVTTGTSAVDAALLTGESTPRPIAPGDLVLAGTLNVGQTIRVMTEAIGSETRVGGLMAMVEQGLRERTPIVRLTDRIAGWFVFGLGTSALMVLLTVGLTQGLQEGIRRTVAMLIVACPCALGLATPLTLALAVGRAARRGILIKDAGVLETLARSGVLLFDKTGTLTLGQPQVVGIFGDRGLCEAIAAAEAQSRHPLAAALRNLNATSFASGSEIENHPSLAASLDPHRPAPQVTDCHDAQDGGLSARWDSRALLIGSPGFMQRRGVSVEHSLQQQADAWESEGKTVVLAAVDARVVTVLALQDEPRPGAAEVVAAVEGHGWMPWLISGDAMGPVARVAAKVGIPAEHCRAAMTPEDKLERVREHLNGGPVVMVGDGTNDAAAMAAASVGIAMAEGAAVAARTADVCLTGSDPHRLPELIRLSALTLGVIRQNLVISLGYNAIALGLAAAGWITPLFAAILMPISSFSVVGLAVWRLGWGRRSTEIGSIPSRIQRGWSFGNRPERT